MKNIGLPQLRQTYGYDCGAKALQAVLAYYGIEVREEYIIKRTKTSEDGTSIEGIVETVSAYGLKSTSREMSIKDIKDYLNKKIPVILALQAWTKKEDVDWETDWDDGHYVVAAGYTRNKIIFEDPFSFVRTYLTCDELEKRWHDVGVDGKKYFHHGIAIFGEKKKFKRDRLIHMD
ncbi:hypothetical protein CVU82_02860 [Candidatus Falkowbacteria bacterium HGW-Falkowbacteria-1]|jgi:ABC-type bacteriocin/lantibiotic exporter with double-glycine peptidase domain|uniref:Peptidase C39 domain-containing protein n=1 Tax=Candidatus Falkowbacteria bacterium HGW-Falkowbacteria-1 TaxID=2013768 RepID=A0A2N2E9V1_9BACT|nr:MAG: hypothetical protein CVU82_02860 [Candidatus Falkowbacteria bacterium HGW-Falkowbacteria-1]